MSRRYESLNARTSAPIKLQIRPAAKFTNLKSAPNAKASSPKHPSKSLSAEARDNLNKIVTAQKYAEDNFEYKMKSHADWILIDLLIQNDAKERSTVVKHVIETASVSPGTVRAMFSRFQKCGYIQSQQRIGRSELYRPTEKLKKHIEKWARANFSPRES